MRVWGKGRGEPDLEKGEDTDGLGDVSHGEEGAGLGLAGNGNNTLNGEQTITNSTLNG